MIDATCASASYREFAEGYGPGADDMRRGWREYLPEGAEPRDPLASPLFAQDLEGAAPAWVLTAEFDTLRDEGEEYARRLGATLRRYPGTIHGFFTMPGIFQLRACRDGRCRGVPEIALVTCESGAGRGGVPMSRAARVYSPGGRGIAAPTATGRPKSGVPSGFQVNGCARGERCRPQPCPASGLAW